MRICSLFSDGSRWFSVLLYFIVNQSDIVDWGYTVGHPDLIDVDARRGGPWGKQTSIEAIMERLIVDVTQRRRYNFYKIIPTPLKICYLDSKELEYANLTEFLELDENQEKWCDMNWNVQFSNNNCCIYLYNRIMYTNVFGTCK